MTSRATPTYYTPPTGRLAPSPTGGLHVGHARTFLIAWLAARSASGRVILRIEDIDSSRLRPGAIEAIIQDLRWLGLDWDEGPDVGGPHTPYLQSQRLDRYAAALRHLQSRELVYPCTCTRSDIARAASAPHAEDEGPSYPGTCSSRTVADAVSITGRPYCWRFRASSEPIGWHDLIRGKCSISVAKNGGDFIVGRSSGEPSYQLAVVCDDAAMGITQVIRGDDLILSTPRQIQLYQAFGWREPTFGHVPLVLDAQGRRLAKRDDSIKLATLRENGFSARELVAKVAKSCNLEGAESQETPQSLIDRFDLKQIPPTIWVYQ